MKYTITLDVGLGHDVIALLRNLDVPVELAFGQNEADYSSYYFYRPDESVTFFELVDDHHGRWEISIDGLASYSDYAYFPYLVDSLYLQSYGKRYCPDGKNSVFALYGEEWREKCIGEEVAQIKAALTVAPRYYPIMPFDPSCVSLGQLARYGVNLYSATSRIYGYIQYLMNQGELMPATIEQMLQDEADFSNDMVTDVPQHISIGKVRSWQLDGSETWESFSAKDVEQLLGLADAYEHGEPVDGVVLNDIGTLYQEGIGVEPDGGKAAYWFREAYRQGDQIYAPANLGDLYRKGGRNLPASLPQAMAAYQLSDEPYAQYRVGQAYEEGWNGEPDKEEAMRWYQLSAQAGHHLAVKRLAQEKE